MSYRGGFRGKGRGRGRSLGGRRPVAVAADDAPVEKRLPKFEKIKSLRPGQQSYDLIVKLDEVNLESSLTERRRGRTVTNKVAQVLIGDETGSINFIVRQPEKASSLKSGSTFLLLNVRMRRALDEFWIEADNWAAIKPLEGNEELVPKDFELNFELNKADDRSKKTPQKPVFTTVSSLEPDQRGVSVIVKVIDVSVEERKRPDGTIANAASATIGDLTGVITLNSRGQLPEVLQKDAVIAVFNARIAMVKGFMRLNLDRWSSLKSLDSLEKNLLPEKYITSTDSPNLEKNMSTIEYELREE
jgi:ssDNA-binding replication factor A large subunit